MNIDKVINTIMGQNDWTETYQNENKILAPLLDEIEEIVDQNIKSFVRGVLLHCSDFWVIPSSFSGKYHPPDERGTGGNILHTQRVFRVCRILSESHNLSRHEQDQLYAAAILHDVLKGRTWQEGDNPRYDPMHPYTVDAFVKSIEKTDKEYGTEDQSLTIFIEEDDKEAILRAVRCHMGKWSPIPETYPITLVESLVHIADVIAAKLHLITDAEELIERWMLDG